MAKNGFKEVGHMEYPKIGKLPWVSWIDWDVLFKDIVDLDFDLEVVGEDIVKFDGHVIYDDLSFLGDFDGVTGLMWRYVLYTMQEGAVYFGPYMIDWIFFVSGHPFTSEFGSYIHLILTLLYCEEYGINLKHGTNQSDDNLSFFDGPFDRNEQADFYEKLGYPIKVEATYVFSEHKMVSFLRNWVGYIFNEENVEFCGDLQSRYINMIHRERGSPEIFLSIANDVNVDALIGQLASFSSSAAMVVKPLFEIGRAHV